MEDISLAYPAKFAKEEGGFVVTFRDVPEAITQGDDMAGALANAEDALSAALAMYAKAGEDLPVASAPKRGEHVIHAAPVLVAKVALRQTLTALGIRPTELARRLKVDEKDVRRLLDPFYQSKLPSLDAALRAVGRRAVLHVMPISGARDLPVRNSAPVRKAG